MQQEDAEMGDKNDADEPPTVVSEARNTKQTASARKVNKLFDIFRVFLVVWVHIWYESLIHLVNEG